MCHPKNVRLECSKNRCTSLADLEEIARDVSELLDGHMLMDDSSANRSQSLVTRDLILNYDSGDDVMIRKMHLT